MPVFGKDPLRESDKRSPLVLNISFLEGTIPTEYERWHKLDICHQGQEKQSSYNVPTINYATANIEVGLFNKDNLLRAVWAETKTKERKWLIRGIRAYKLWKIGMPNMIQILPIAGLINKHGEVKIAYGMLKTYRLYEDTKPVWISESLDSLSDISLKFFDASNTLKEIEKKD